MSKIIIAVSGTQLLHSFYFFFLEDIWFNQFFLLVPVGKRHHDVERGQTQMEVEKGIAVSDVVFLIIHGPAEAIFAHHTLSGRPFAFFCLHQPVDLGITGWTDATGVKEAAYKTIAWEQVCTRRISILLNVPGIEGAEKEDDQANDALSVPPLHHPRAAVTWCLGAADVGHKTQQAGVTLSIWQITPSITLEQHWTDKTCFGWT